MSDNVYVRMGLMKVSILYHPHSEHARIVEDFARDFTHQTDKRLELVSLETREGSAFALLYDVTKYPAILALRDDGSLLKMWSGPVMPLINEISYYSEG